MGVRAGQGYGTTKPKRLVCPDCGKKGVSQWKATAHGLVRGCQYCQASWGEAGWALYQSSKQDVEQPKAKAVITRKKDRGWSIVEVNGERVGIADRIPGALGLSAHWLVRFDEAFRFPAGRIGSTQYSSADAVRDGAVSAYQARQRQSVSTQ